MSLKTIVILLILVIVIVSTYALFTVYDEIGDKVYSFNKAKTKLLSNKVPVCMRAQNTFLKHGTNSLVWLKSALNEPDYQKRIPIILSLLSQIDEKAYVSSFCQVAEQNIEYIPLSVNFTDPRIIRGLPEEDIARILTSLKKAIQITDDVELENELKESLNIINEASGDKNNEK